MWMLMHNVFEVTIMTGSGVIDGNTLVCRCRTNEYDDDLQICNQDKIIFVIKGNVCTKQAVLN